MTESLPTGVATRVLSFAQERLWIIHKIVEDKALYNTAMVFDLRGWVNVPALERSMVEVIRRHDVLRTGFMDTSGEATLVHMPVEAFPISVEDLRGGEHPRELAQQHQRAVLSQPFDLSSPPLLRAVLYHLREGEHQLALTVHHIIFDGASIDVFLREIEVLYPALMGDGAHALPALPLQSQDVAARERQLIRGERRQRLLDFWMRELAGELPVLALPSDRHRPSVQTYRGATLLAPMSHTWMEHLERASRASRVTPFMYVLAAYAIWLCRYSGQQEVVIGTPFAQRSDKETHNLIGFLVNTVAIRIQMRNGLPFREFLHGVRDSCFAAYSHGELPFADLVGALGGQRELAHSPVFQTMLVVQNTRPRVQLAPDLRASYAGEVHGDRARFDIALVLDPLEAGASLSLEYNTDLFDATTAKRMLTHLTGLLSEAVANPDVMTDKLPLLGSAERMRALVTWNDTGSLSAPGLVHALFQSRAQETPNAIALISSGTTWTYGELDRRANQLAHLLRLRGIRPEISVGALLERSPELVCTMLAIFKAGGVYLPIDPAYPDERIAFMIEDSRASLLVTGQGLKKRFDALLAKQAPHCRPPTWDWQDHGAALEEQPDGPVANNAVPGNLAYVIYTSGSTGKPKGVEVSHGALFNLVKAKITGFGVYPHSCVLQFVSFGFDVSVSDVYMTLAAGARLLLRPADVVGGEPLARLLRDHGVTIIVLPASVLATVPASDLPALKSVVAGGEACSAELVNRWAEQRCFINAYGPTEATICTTMARCDPHSGQPPIGRPIPHARIYVLDTNLEPVPPGVTGELYISGAGLARGYLARPGLTAERFIPDPFAGQDPSVPPGGRLYRTGDHARYLPDGSIAFVERVDDQVKVRGSRIELGEIEAVLRQHPCVQDAVVSAQAIGAGGKHLVAYVVPLPSAEIDSHRIAIELRALLPEHMIPAAIIPLEFFPRTANGKIDRRSLPVPETLGHGVRHAYVAPRSLTEEVLVAIFGEVLELNAVGAEDDFFALGGQSILAAQAMARASERFELNLSLRLLFESPTAAALAPRIEAALMEQIKAMDVEDVARALAHENTAGKGNSA